MNSVLLVGAYGQTNLGDDLLMVVFLKLLSDLGVNIFHITLSDVNCVPPEAVSDNPPELFFHETYTTSLLGWFKIIYQVDTIVYGGGTLFKELSQSSGRNQYGTLARLLILNFIGRLLGKTIIHAHVAVGKLDTRIGRWLTKCSLKLGHLTIFRDQESELFVQQRLGIKPTSVCTYTDAVFIEKLACNQYKLQLPPVRPDAKRVVGFNAVGKSMLPDGSDWETYCQELLEIVRQLIADQNQIIFVPFQHKYNPTHDMMFLQHMLADQLSTEERQWVYLLKSLPISRLHSLFDQIDVFVAMRFHAMILACVTHTPYIGIEYDTKCTRFNRENDYSFRLTLNTLDRANFFAVYEALLEALPSTRKVLETIAAKNRALGEESWQVVLKKLDR